MEVAYPYQLGGIYRSFSSEEQRSFLDHSAFRFDLPLVAGKKDA